MELEIKEETKKDFLRKGGLFLEEKIHIIIIGLFLVGFFFCLFLWNKYVENPAWSEERKQAYINSQNDRTIFDEKKFNEVVEEWKRRHAEYLKEISGIKDIYGLNEE